ncbi:RNA-dependent DNA polymerase [Opitutaceae bacterium TAV4]|nr:RNA-dependent DNA polymerase [Opitutaceae bacterium TAV4]RRJ97922.1 RNA-dependent DNA polymerase [Opitutaceae bacterium TAV4]RRK02469.1 RNA-dependent DNA polymerase [Opitutaceae bacterium TAV3]
MPRKHRHLFEKVITLENLFAAAENASRGRSGKVPVARGFAELEKTVVTLRDELLAGTWQPGRYYYFTITDPKEREVAAAPFRDRVVHHALVRVLEPIFEPRFIVDSFACRPGKGTHAALARAREFTRSHRYCLKCDIKKYFPNIDHALLLREVGRAVDDARVLELIGRILASHADGAAQEWRAGAGLFDVEQRPRGLPIGNLTSQFLANVHLHPLDLFVKQTLRVKGYVRYVDDFLLFGDDRAALKAHGQRVREFVRTLRLRVHPDKFRLSRTEQGVDFVGFVAFPDGRIRVRDSNVRRFTRRLRRQAWCVRTGRMDFDDLCQRACSWAAHAGHAQSRGLLQDIFSGIFHLPNKGSWA